jgi:hemoglobin
MGARMRPVQLESNLAFEIGLCRVATVVDRFYDELSDRSDLTEPFRKVGGWQQHKARMTYFWWVALGGNPGSEEHLKMIDRQRRDGFNSKSLDAWMRLFSDVVFANVDQVLAEAWMEQAEYLKAILLLPASPLTSARSVDFSRDLAQQTESLSPAV